MKTKLKTIKVISFFVLLFFVINMLSPVFAPQGTPDRITDNPINSLDYLAFGDSECHSSISPMELWKTYGYVGYNCGVDAQPIRDAYYQLEEILQLQSPRVVLLETNLIYRKLGLNLEAKALFEHFIGKTLALYKNHDQWKNLFFAQVSSVSQSKNKIFKGMQYNTNIVPYKGGPYVSTTNEVEKIGIMQQIYLDKIVKLCKEKNIQLVLYCVPSPKCWIMAKHNGVAEYANENSLPFLDLNLTVEDIGIDWGNDTNDKGDHLNFFGALKVTNYLGSYLHEHTSLPDRRSDTAYVKWNEDLNDYLKTTGQIA